VRSLPEFAFPQSAFTGIVFFMSQHQESGQSGVRTVTVDLAVAAIIFALGALVAWDSARLGAEWGSDGPQTGYFPYYIGLITCVCGVVSFVPPLLKLKSDHSVFVTYEQLKQVMVILAPSTAYVLGVQFLGIYASSAAFILLFMRVAGKYSWLRSFLVGLGVSLGAMVMFEIWFKTPLPKGPGDEPVVELLTRFSSLVVSWFGS
jgi:hypothetical protein